MTANLELFRNVYAICKKAGSTYDYLPEQGTKYPFIYLNNTLNTNTINNDFFGDITITIHVYSLRTERPLLDIIIDDLERNLKSIDSEHYFFNFNNITTQSIADNTDVEPLIHVTLDVAFTYNRKDN